MVQLEMNGFVSAAAAVTPAPRVHAPPKVPLKPGMEDLEVYGSVCDTLFSRVTLENIK